MCSGLLKVKREGIKIPTLQTEERYNRGKELEEGERKRIRKGEEVNFPNKKGRYEINTKGKRENKMFHHAYFMY